MYLTTSAYGSHAHPYVLACLVPRLSPERLRQKLIMV